MFSEAGSLLAAFIATIHFRNERYHGLCTFTFKLRKFCYPSDPVYAAVFIPTLHCRDKGS